MRSSRFVVACAALVLSVSYATADDVQAASSPSVSDELAETAEAYKASVLAQSQALREKRIKVMTIETGITERKKVLAESDPACMKIEAEIAELRTRISKKVAEKELLMKDDPELLRLNQELSDTKTIVEQDKAALQACIRERKKLEWGAK